MLNALATDGSQIAHGLPIRFQCTMGSAAIVTYCGMTSTVAGIIRVASIKNRIAFPRKGRSFERA